MSPEQRPSSASTGPKRAASPLCMALAWWLVAAWAGCTESPTQVIVYVDAEGGLRNEADHLRIRVQGRDGLDDAARIDKLDETLTGEIAWPVKLALAPAGGDAERVFWIEAEASSGQSVLATARLLSGYVDGETRYARLLIEEACRSVSCAVEDDTCHDGQCVPAYRNPAELGKSPKTASDFDPGDGGSTGPDRDGSASDDGGAFMDGRVPGDDGGMGPGTDAGPPPECRLDTDCKDLTRPVCGDDGRCRGCRANTECATSACEDSGECTVPSRIVYFAPNAPFVSDCGTASAPCTYLPDALALLTVDRPVLSIAKGTYTGLQFDFSAPARVRIVADGVTLNLLGAASGPGIFVRAGADVSVDGLTIRGATEDGPGRPGSGIVCAGGTLALRRVSLLNNAFIGMSADNCVVSVSDSLIDNNGDYGLRFASGKGSIERSIISNNLRGGISLFDPSPMRIANNLITGNSSVSNYDGAIRSNGATGTDTVIAFNTITGNFVNPAYIGILGCAPDFVVDSNIVWGNKVGPDAESDLAQTFINCTVTHSLTEAEAIVGSSSTFSDMITEDPGFIDATNGNYGLNAGSPALNRGTPGLAGDLDQAGKPRTIGSGPDLGCYER